MAAFSPWLRTAGLSLVLGGAAELLSKPPAFAPSSLDKGPADAPTYAFQGPHMTTGQGNCVPLLYGRCRIGGALISLGISPETWTTNGFGGAAPDEVGTRGGNGDTAPWVWAVAPVQG
jgi:predicted phage tail protein